MGAMCFTLKTLFRICLSAVPEVSDHMEFCSFKWMIEFFYQWLKYINNNGSCSATLSWDIYAPSSSYLAASKNKIPKLNYEFSVTVCIWLWLCWHKMSCLSIYSGVVFVTQNNLLYAYCLENVWTALWYWRCIQRKSFFICLHSHGIILLTTERTTSNPSTARGKFSRNKAWMESFDIPVFSWYNLLMILVLVGVLFEELLNQVRIFS